MVIRDTYHTGGEANFKPHIKRTEEAAVDSIYTDLILREIDEWTEVLVKKRASNFVTTLLTLSLTTARDLVHETRSRTKCTKEPRP